MTDKTEFLEIKVMASASRPIDGTQMGIIEKLQQNVIWNKSNGDDFYNVFSIRNDDDERCGGRYKSGISMDIPLYTKAETAMSIKSVRQTFLQMKWCPCRYSYNSR